MIEDLVARGFVTRNLAQLAHWKTKSYAQHMALGSFYDGLVGKLDGIVEMYQGASGLISNVSVPSHKTPSTILDHITEEAEWLRSNRSEIAEDNCAIENAVDELIGLYLSTAYKLKNLS